MANPSNRIPFIESQANRVVTIETMPTPSNLFKSHPQLQSLLFRLPAELRNIIFLYATAPDTSLDQSRPGTVPSHRSSFSTKPRHHTALLLTCRLAWLEANAWPLQQTTHPFRLTDWIGPAWIDAEVDHVERLGELVDRLTALGRHRVALSLIWTGAAISEEELEELRTQPQEDLRLHLKDIAVEVAQRSLGALAMYAGEVRLEMQTLPGEMERAVRMYVEAFRQVKEIWMEEGENGFGCGLALRDGCEDWSGWFEEDESGEKGKKTEYRVFTLVWDKVERSGDEKGGDALQGDDEEGSMEGALGSAIRNEYEERWAAEDSLLMFSSEVIKPIRT